MEENSLFSNFPERSSQMQTKEKKKNEKTKPSVQAPLAQSVAHESYVLRVGGSSPPWSNLFFPSHIYFINTKKGSTFLLSARIELATLGL